jgi:hypothetical protein
VSLTLDTRAFRAALHEYERATKKDEAEILNHAARNVAFRAAQRTPKADRSKIVAGLHKDPRLRFALTSLQLRKKGRGILKRGAFARAVRGFVGKRAASSGYIRVGWAPAIEQLGGSFRGRKPRSKSPAAHGYGKPATPSRLFAVLANMAVGSGAVGLPALQGALNFVAADMGNYARRKMQKTANKYRGT